MAKARLEIFSAGIRVYDRDDGNHPEPYQWFCAVRAIDRHTVELCGVLASPSKEFRRGIARELLGFGFKAAISYKADGRRKLWDLRRVARLAD